MIKQSILTLLILSSMISCQAPKKKADLIVHNAVVYTVDEGFTTQQAFAIKDGKFIAIGSDEAILGNYESDSTRDAEGKPVYPGLIDAHCHFFGYGYNLLKRADLAGTISFEEIILRLQAHNERFHPDWLEGRGWDQNDWEVKQFPDKSQLDEAFPDIPVFITRIDGHAGLANTLALQEAGIDGNTKVQGGEVVLKNGAPSGLLIDNAMELITKVIPAPDEEMMRKMLQEAEKNCFAVGLTSVQDAGLGRDTVELIDRMQQEGSLKMRIYAMLSPSVENLETFVVNGPYSTERLNVCSIKLYADGALGSRGAKMLEPYSDDPGNTGLFIHPPAFYKRFYDSAYKYGYQVNTHAIGDAANRFVLNLYSDYLHKDNDRRWRIEHAQVVNPADFDLFGEYKIIPSVQPTHATSDMYWAENRLGPDRIKGAYAYKKLLDENGWIPLGTDFPVESINPMLTFYAAVTRQDTSGYPPGGFQPENALTREEALKGMTIWAAKAAFEEDVKGSIEAGKFADFVILDEDIMKIEMSKVPRIKVTGTWLNGEKVF